MLFADSADFVFGVRVSLRRTRKENRPPEKRTGHLIPRNNVDGKQKAQEYFRDVTSNTMLTYVA